MTKPFYQEDGITIYHGDEADVLPALSGIDLVFTSPPYNLGTTSGGGFADVRKYAGMKMGKWGGGDLAYGYDVHDDAMPHEKYVAWQKAFLRRAWATLKPTGAIYYNHKPRVQKGVLITPFDYNPGLPVRQIVIWERAGGINFAPTHYLPCHEWILILAHPAFRLKSKGASGAKDVWSIPQERGNPHPAPFPLGLPLRALETVKPGLVLDPFTGSGTTLVAAKQSGWTAIGVDKSERWCEYAANRVRREERTAA